MKRFLVGLLLLVLIAPMTVKADEIIIGTGTVTTYSAPFNNFYKNSWNETIYPASSFSSACVINSVAYEVATASPVTMSTLKIYMGETSRSTFSSTSDWTPESDLTLVYSGTNVVIGSTTGWQEIQLDSPFTYEGEDNLVIVVSKTTANYSSSLKFYYTSETNTCMYRQSDSDLSYAEYPTGVGTRTAYKANVKLNVTPFVLTCHKPTAVELIGATPTTITMGWTPYPGTGAFDVYISDEEAPSATTTPTASNITDTSYTFTGLTGGTVYNCYVRTNCGDGDVSGWRSIIACTEPDFSGNGTESSPYLLYSKADLDALTSVMSNGWTTSGKYFKVMRDIDGITSSIGVNTAFEGYFDGNGYSIEVDINGAGSVGLFSALDPGAVVSNVTVNGSIVSTGTKVGGIVGDVNLSSSETGDEDIYIINCVNNATINASVSYVGGIVGYYNGKNDETTSHLYVVDCINRGDIFGSGSYHGGIVGYLTYYGVVDNCTNRGDVNGQSYSAGIVGRSYGRCVVQNCANIGDIIATTYSGGIVGYNYGSILRNSYNIGDVTGSSYCGGIAGYNYAYNYTGYGRVDNCYNGGVLTATSTTTSGAAIGYQGYSSTGYYGYATGLYYLDGSYSIAIGSNSNTTQVQYLVRFTQDENDPTVCTLLAPGYGGSTDLRTALNDWINGDEEYNEWLTDIYGNNHYFPTFVVGNPPGLEVTPNPLAMGPRPVGSWMHNETLTLTNTGQIPVDVSTMDFANTNFFVLDANANNPELPVTVDPEESIDIYVTTNPDATTSAGMVTAEFVAVWNNNVRSVSTATITAEAYIPVVPDVVETPQTVSTYPYSTTQSTSSIYDNYELPGENSDGPDGVYKLVITEDAILNIEMTEGNNPKLALYSEDFNGQGGPGIDNYYTGPEIGAGGGATEEFLFDQADMVTHPGQGAGGSDVSAICGSGINYGPNANWATGAGTYYLLADDFVCETETTINEMEFYGYQTGSGLTSTFTGLYLQIFDGNPMEGGQPVWGDNATNLMSSTEWTGIYRTTATALTSTDRPIMKVVASGLDITLQPGTYWVTVGFTGSLSSGPWGVPRAIWGQSVSGNGLQKTSTGWTIWDDSGQQGLPMILRGFSERGSFMLSPLAQEPNIGSGSMEIADMMTEEEMAQVANNRDEYPVSFGGDNPITNLTVTPGTYYLVASSTSAQYILNVDKATIPAPLPAVAVSPANGESNVTSPVTLRWTLGQFTTEYQLLMGTTYPPSEVVVDWTDDLAQSYTTGVLLNNKNYFWRINERNVSGTTEGEVWGFTTTFNIPQGLVAADYELYEGEAAELSWTAVQDRNAKSIRGYNVYQDGVKVNDAVIPTNSYDVEGLTYNMEGYEFNVTAVYDEGESAMSEGILVRVSGNGMASGTVFEQDGATTIEGATVTFTGLDEYGVEQTFSFTTGSDGTYYGEVLAGEYSATASKAGYQDAPYINEEGEPVVLFVYDVETPDINIIMYEEYNPVAEVIAEEVSDEMVKVSWSWSMMSALIEDFETGDFSMFPWNNEVSSYPWDITTTNPYEGTYCMKSTNNGVDGTTSAVEVTVDIPRDGLVSFYVRISCESGWDNGYFYIDGVQKGSFTGEGNWSKREYDITEGEHTFRWEYTKDGSLSSGEDAMYVDYINFTDQPEPAQPGWIYYDDGVNVDAIGLTAGGPFYWGIMFPASTMAGYEGYSLYKVSMFDYTAHTGNILIYQGGTTSPGTLIHTEAYTNTGSLDFVEVELSSVLPIDPTQSMWIVLNNDNEQYVAACCNDTGNPNGRWISTDGTTWEDIAALGLPYTWMIRGYVDNGRGSVATLSSDVVREEIEYENRAVGGVLTSDPNAKVTVAGVPEEAARGMRALQNYNVYRTNCYVEEYNEETVELLGSTFDTVFMDMSWGTTEAGVYKWGVSCVYGGNRESEIVWNDNKVENKKVLEEELISYVYEGEEVGVAGENKKAAMEGETVSYVNRDYMMQPSPDQSGWIYYDDGVNVDAIGLTYGGSFYWGIMFPESVMSEYNGYNLTKVSMYDYTAHTGTIMIYQGGTTSPGTLVYTEPYTNTGSSQFVEVELTTEVAIDPTQTMWIVLNNDNGQYVAAACNNTGDPNGRWISTDGTTWEDVATLGLSYTWMIRGYVESSGTGVGGLQGPTESPIVWSNCLDKDMWTTLDVTVTTNSGDNVAGTTVEFINVSEPEMGYDLEVTMDETGIYEWEEVRKGTYVYTIALEGYQSCAVGDTIEIWEATTVECMMEEILGAITNLYVSPTGWAMWDGTGGSAPIQEGDEFMFDFEDGGLTGWTTIDADGDGFVWNNTSTSLGAGYGHQSQYCAYSQSYDNWYGTLNPDNYLVTAEKYMIGSNSVLSFYACAQDNLYAAEHYGVAISTEGNTSASDFTTIWEETLTAKSNGDKGMRGMNAQGTWYQKSVDLSEYAGQEVYIAIRHFNVTDQYWLDIDDVSLSNGSDRGERALQGYKVLLDNVYEADVTVPYYQHDVTNLVEGNEYTTQVAAMFATGMGAWSEYTWTYADCSNYEGVEEVEAEVSGNTVTLTWDGSGPIPPVPGGDEFMFDFEDGIQGWTKIDADGDGYNWNHSTEVSSYLIITPYNGSLGCVMSESYYNPAFAALNPDNYLVSPQKYSIGENSTLSFYVCAQDAAYPAEHYGVAISTEGNTSASDFTTIWEETLTAKSVGGDKGMRGMNAQGTWYQKSVDLSEYAGQEVYIAFRHFNVSDQFVINIDDVELSAGAKAGGREVLFDQSEMVTNPGAGVGGADVSALQGSQTTYGPNVSNGLSYAVADDFTLTGASTIEEIEVYSYQTGSSTTSTYTGMYVEIYDGNPMSGGQVIWGDRTTNLMTSTAFTGIYRTTSTDLTNSQRPIMSVTASGLNIELEAGEYWMSYTLEGTLTSGPWAMPRVIPGEMTTGNGLQDQAGTWATLIDDGSGTAYGIAMKISGSGNGGPVPPVGGGVYVFRDGELLTPTAVTTGTYVDEEVPDGVYNYCVRTVYEDYAMSCPVCVEVEVPGGIECGAPEDLYGEYYWESGTYGAHVIWPYDNTVPVGEWLYYDDGVNVDAIGAGGTLYWGVMFPTEAISGYEGTSLTKVQMYDYEAGSYTLNIYYGGTSAPATLVHSQNFTTTGSNTWHEIELSSALPLDVTQNLWVTLYNSGVQFPGAVSNDTGDPNGRWVSTDGVQWIDVATAGLVYTFMVRAYVTNETEGGEVVELSGFEGEVASGEIEAKGQEEAVETRPITGSSRSLDHYNVYRGETEGEYELIAEVPAEGNGGEYYDDLTGHPGTYYYQVTAVYEEGGETCESEPANSVTNPDEDYVMVEVTNVEDNEMRGVTVYPNPTKGELRIEAEGMSRITVTSVLGQVMMDKGVTSDEEMIDMSQMEAGVYMVQIVSESGVTVKRITVIK